jgi:hypothetical protein
MDILLVDGDTGQALRLLQDLAPEPRNFLRVDEAHIANGALSPHPALTSVVLVDFDRPGPATMRALNRLWAGDTTPPAFLVTRQDSEGEALLAAMADASPVPSSWQADIGLDRRWPELRCEAAQLHMRELRGLPMEGMLALTRLVDACA